ncbi:DNA adenine methylase [Acinetobacter modestus]|uniref:DNA adenine methylase n=1 Tax=Acinetobacter modestus TaxID=1776740 RepID=UPI0030170733
MNSIAHPVIRYHGGKFRLASWVISHFPKHHLCYTEVFGGAAGVLIQKERSYAEVYNDLDGGIVNLFRVLRSQSKRAQLIEQLIFTPYARDEFDLAWESTDDEIEHARRIIIRAQMGFGSAGATKGKTGFRIDTKRKYGTAQSLWAEYPEHLAQIGQRLQGVLIENRDAIQVLKDHDAPSTLHYVDPPYMHDTRHIGAKFGHYYRHELDDSQHIQLLETLTNLNGMVVLSGYENEMYDDYLKGWTKRTTQSRIASHRGAGLRTECLWISPNALYTDLFGGGHE